MVPAARCASSTILLGEASIHVEVVLSASVSASSASAPTGVFSSWLMFATKSVRTGIEAARR